MNFSDYVELEKRAEAHSLGDDPSLAQLLHIIQFKQAVVRGQKRTMSDLATWEKNIANCVEQRIKEAEGLQMITDDVRHEVAAKMRGYDVSEFKESAIVPFLDCLGVGYLNWREVLDSLADLIGRPAYRPVIPNAMDGYVFCPQCGAPIGEYGVPNYCHSCGVAIRNGH